ncbi:MAG TPA: EFR1 family ferrodoxin, partial [Candidatus Lokiarchaeia archaeon]
TGNSLKVAKDLAGKLEDTELIPIAKVWKEESIVAKTEKVGFVHPLYWWGLPDIVYTFLNKLNLDQTNYIFDIITCGHAGSGSALHTIKELLKKKNKNLNSGFFIEMPDNYLPVYDVVPKEKQKEIFESAEKKVDDIANIIKRDESKVEKESLSSVGKVVNKKFRKKVHESDKKFCVDEKCNSDGICEKICPVNNIIIVEGKPQWQHNCQRCLACIHYCTQKAIQWKQKTSNKGRYHNPDVTLKEIMQQKPA